ncbi:MAG: beta-phosphoglucomutase [Parerythrobacter sp.]
MGRNPQLLPVPQADGASFRRDRYDAATAACDATLFALANGTLGVRGGIDELGNDVAAFAPSGFARRPISYHEAFPGYADGTDSRFPLPSPVALHIAVDGEPIAFTPDDMAQFDIAFDLEQAILRRRTVWDLGGGRALEVYVERLVPMGAGPVCISTISVCPVGFSATLALTCPVELAGAERATGDADDPRISLSAGVAPVSERERNGILHCMFGAQDGVDAPYVAVVQHLSSEATGTNLRRERHCADGEWLDLRRTVAYGIGADAADDALAVIRTASGEGTAALVAHHTAILDAFGQSAAITIAGQDDLASAIRFNLLHVLMSSSASARHGVAAKGLTGEGYEGHVFWDGECFVLPVLALTQPERARHMLEWRILRLDDARRNARKLSHATGALYPWRTIDGGECSSHYPTGAAQYHINADIAHAVQFYLAVTGDTDFATLAAEMVFETARIWLEIGHYDARRAGRRGGAFVIPGVTGPDEYSAMVDNDYYTNALAAAHLEFAATLAAKDGPCDAAALKDIRARIGLDDEEVERWRSAAAAIARPVDARSGVSPQDDAFLGKAPFPHGHTPGRPLLLDHHPMHIFRHQVCKQGDVIQAHAVRGQGIPQMQKARDLAFYEPLTTHDSTLSATAFGIVSCETGAFDAALAFQQEAAFVDIENRHANSHHGAHMAAMAGSWLILVQGWGGMLAAGDMLHFRPRCPADWPAYSFRLQWRGSVVEVAVTAGDTSYRLIDGPPLALHDYGRPVTVTQGEPHRIDRPALKAVIFDLDGVLTDTAEAHFHAWKRLCDEELLPFSRSLNDRLKGVSRRASLDIILTAANASRSEADFTRMLARKNAFYRAAIAGYSPADLFKGARELLLACLDAGLRIGLASASRNAGDVVRALGIADLFDCITDAATIRNGKPDPEIFLRTAETLGIAPASCVGVEDARAGVTAINAAGMVAIGIGDANELDAAAVIVPQIGDVTVPALHTAITDNKNKTLGE